MADYSIHTGQVRKFSVPDYVLFALTLLVSAGIGLFYALRDRRRNTPEEFLLGGHRMHVLPVAMSLMVTFVSSLTLLSYPAEMYNFDTMFWWLALGFVVAVGGSVLVFIPFFYRLGVTSTFEYLEMRFSKTVRLLGSLTMICQTWLYMAVLLYAPSLSLNAVTGINLWGCVAAMGVVVTFYTTLGGMKAVLWTDTFQAVVIVSGLIVILIQGVQVQGGMGTVWGIASNRSRIVFDQISPDPKVRHSVWSVVIGGGVFWMALYGINQAQVQRCLSCPSVGKARLAMLLSFPGWVIIKCMSCLLGVVMFAFYADCDPLKLGLVDKSDQLVPLFVMDIVGTMHGLPGIFVSAVVSASLSSLSSGLNALSAITYSDLMVGLGWKAPSALHATLLSKLLAVVYGLGAIGLAWLVSQLGGILQALYVLYGALGGPVMGVFTLGMFFPWANAWGAVSGQVVSTAFLCWVGLGAFLNQVRTPKSPTSTLACNWTALAPAPNDNTTTISTITTTATATLNLLNSTVWSAGQVTDAPASSDVGVLEPLYRLSYMWYTIVGILIVWAVGLIVSFLTGATNPESLKPGLVCPLLDVVMPCVPSSCRELFHCGVAHGQGRVSTGEESEAAKEERDKLNPSESNTVITVADPMLEENTREDRNCGGKWQPTDTTP